MIIYIAIILAFIFISLVTYELLQRLSLQHARQRLRKRIGKKDDIPAALDPSRPMPFFLLRLPVITKLQARHQKSQLQHSYSAELPRMFDVIALGMRSGLGFDQAFALYVRRFSTPLALTCRERFEVWEKGLIPREDGLKELSSIIEVAIFTRFVSTVIRALNYGAPLTRLLLDLSDEARKVYRLEQQELVAKAPVKMLLPTAALILPAMLLLVIGPIVMDVLERMV